jgi:hypothetical protein
MLAQPVGCVHGRRIYRLCARAREGFLALRTEPCTPPDTWHTLPKCKGPNPPVSGLEPLHCGWSLGGPLDACGQQEVLAGRALLQRVHSTHARQQCHCGIHTVGSPLSLGWPRLRCSERAAPLSRHQPHLGHRACEGHAAEGSGGIAPLNPRHVSTIAHAIDSTLPRRRPVLK